MFAPPNALREFAPPMLMPAYFNAGDDEETKAPVDRPVISPYLQRPLRPLEQVKKEREKKAGMKPGKETDVTGRR